MGPTVVGALMAAGYTISTSGPAERAGIVHRLDVGTSGLMIVAKTDIAYTRLKEAFRNHEVEKTYHALVQGHMDPVSGTIDAPIDRHPKEDHRFAVVAEGKESITHYEVIEFYRSVSLVKVELESSTRWRYNLRSRSSTWKIVSHVTPLVARPRTSL
jgi:23S rRNA pseudouridine1911/1915/1917 synthase